MSQKKSNNELLHTNYSLSSFNIYDLIKYLKSFILEKLQSIKKLSTRREKCLLYCNVNKKSRKQNV